MTHDISIVPINMWYNLVHFVFKTSSKDICDIQWLPKMHYITVDNIKEAWLFSQIAIHRCTDV